MGDFGAGGSVSAQHALVPPLVLRVAPTDGDQAFNAIRLPLVPVACFRLNDPSFAFDSSFLGPEFAPELARLAALVLANPGAPAAIFAHADPVGSDDVNKHISDRRALAVYGVLTRKPELWEDLHDHPVDGDRWGTAALQTMLATVRDGAGAPYYAGDVHRPYGNDTFDAVRRFQADAGLTSDGQAGPATRRALFGAYMDAICTDPAGARFQMQPGDFLGGGQDAGGKVALQGCSRFNPVVLLPADEEGAAGAQRNDDNAPNRRVLVFLFRPKTTVDPSQWPCPRVKELAAGCKAQFWPDGDARRKNGATLRAYKDSRDTMACRFYDRFARRSPCEGAKAPWKAAWDAPTTKMGETRLAIVEAPGVADGAVVTFTVTQVGFGVVGTGTAIAAGEKAVLAWDDWEHPDSYVDQGTLARGAPFAPVSFMFVAQGDGRRATAAAPCTYQDRVYLQLTTDHGDLLARQPYTLLTPWGAREGTTDDDAVLDENGLAPGGASIVLNEQTLVHMGTLEPGWDDEVRA